MSNYVQLKKTIPTVATLVGGLFLPLTPTAASDIQELNSTYRAEFNSAQTQYKTISDNIETLEQVETIHQFASNLMSNIEDLTPEFSKAIDENYWDLI